MKEDNILLGQIEDKISQCRNKYIVTHTAFLDAHQQSLARMQCKKAGIPVFDAQESPAAIPPARAVFYGGYADADRAVMICLPDYAELEDFQPLTVIRAQKSDGGRELTHRDYLGSLTGLGVKRQMTGDILTREDGADIIVLQEIAEFILLNYVKAGRTSLSLWQHPIEELTVSQQTRTVFRDAVASLRLDSIVASVFNLSRSKAAEAITKGLVFVNHVEVTKIDFQLTEGDKIVLRGKGKAALTEVGGRSRKDRQYVTFEKY